MARSANPAAALLHHRWRATLFHPKATLRSSSRRGSHRNDSASNSTQYSNEYPNLALSSLAEIANYVVVVDLVVAVAATLVFAVASDCRAAASAAAVVARHA